uniref:Proteolipid protein 2 n=1 Tax=Sus scrofa TaxID=9823 RepID=A0A4X1SYI9_PIG
MADSERLSAPGCWAACTNFSRTRKGFVLLAEIVVCLVILICFSAATSGFSFLSVIEMIFAAVFFVIYMCDLHTKIQIINWPWSDFFRTLIAAILYLITSILVLVEGGHSSKIAAGVLGLLAACLFGYDAYITFPLRQQRHTAAPTGKCVGVLGGGGVVKGTEKARGLPRARMRTLSLLGTQGFSAKKYHKLQYTYR